MSARPSSVAVPASGPKVPYLPGLDGIRAIAIAAVLLYHGGLKWLPGGFLGVDVFFALSGYLITSLLLADFVKGGRIDLRRFYAGRARRLLPAFLLMLFVVATSATLFMQDSVASTWLDLPWAMNGLSNWWFVLHHQSYFEAIGRPLLLQHTWSLAVEAQFYAVWPLLLVFLLPLIGIKGIGRVALFGAVASGAVVLWLASHLDPASSAATSHVYFGTDTHSMGLFLGAALATLLPPKVPVRSERAGLSPLALSLFGVTVLAGLIYAFHTVNEAVGSRYLIGFPVAALLATALIALTVRGSKGLVARLLALRPLRWIGERSYGMYLWHWPIFQATRPGIDVRVTGLVNLALRLILTAAVAELSYRFVEMPVRRGALKKLWARVRGWNPVTFRFAATAAAAALLLVAVGEATLAQRAATAFASSAPPAILPVDPKLLAATDPSPAPSPAWKFAPRPGHASKPHRSRPRPVGAVTRVPAMLVGDSIMLGVSEWIAHQVNVVEVHAAVSRQATETLDVVRQLALSRDLQPTVIIDLGNNGTVDEPTLRGMLHLLKNCKHVIIVNAKVPRPWQDDNDVLMARVVPAYRNAALADWHAVADGHPEYFGSDGVHPNAEGAAAYAHLVAVTLRRSAERQARLAQTAPAHRLLAARSVRPR